MAAATVTPAPIDNDPPRLKIVAWTNNIAHPSSAVASSVSTSGAIAIPLPMPPPASTINLTAVSPRRNRADAYRLASDNTAMSLPNTIPDDSLTIATTATVAGLDEVVHSPVEPIRPATTTRSPLSTEWPPATGTHTKKAIKVLIVVGVGSRGDVQPFLALGLALMRSGGHQVIIATPAPFGDWIRSFGIPAIEHSVDLVARLRDTHEGSEYRRISKLKQLQRSVAFWVPIIGPFIDHYIDVCSMTRPDVVVAGSMPAMCSPLPCELLGIPYVIMHHTPHHPTTSFSPPIAGIHEQSCGCVNHAKWNVMESQGWQHVWREAVNARRAAHGRPIYKNKVGVEEFTRRYYTFYFPRRSLAYSQLESRQKLMHSDHVPVVYTYSKYLLPKPSDWPANEHVAGPMRMPPAVVDITTEYVPTPQLKSFLEHDPKDQPVYGLLRYTMNSSLNDCSMLPVYLNEEKMQKFIGLLHRALSRASCRGIVCTTGCKSPPSPPSNVMHVTDVPHDWLFARCSAIVHHGGAGTTQSALLAGRPSVIVAFGFDQPFWAARIKRLGVGLPGGTIGSVNEKSLATAIREVRQAPSMAKMAKDLGDFIRDEDGTTTAIKVIEQHVADYNDGKLQKMMMFDISTPPSSCSCTIL